MQVPEIPEGTGFVTVLLAICFSLVLAVGFNIYGPPDKPYVPAGTSDEVRIEAHKAWAEATKAYYEQD